MSVNNSARSWGHKRDKFSTFFNMKVCCVFSLESLHRGDSNEYTQYTIFNIKEKSALIIPNLKVLDFFSSGLKDEFETAAMDGPSVFEPLKFCCIFNLEFAF